MKPVAYYCPCVNGPVPLDHWSRLQCTDPPMPLGWILSLTKERQADTDHSGGAITATRLLTCPRQTLIEDFIEPLPDDPTWGLVFDPRRMNSAHFGTTIHAEIAANTPGGGYKEVRFPLPGAELPELDFGGGVTCRLSGRIDYLHPDTIVLEDYKIHSEGKQRTEWNKKYVAPEIRAQFGIYKPLVEASVKDANVTHALVWHGAMTSANNEAPPWFKTPVSPMTLTEIGSLRPYGAKQTVREIIRMYQWALGEIAKIAAPRHSREWYAAFDALLTHVPMVGESMFRGTKCASYCGAAQPYCFWVAGRTEVL